MCLGYKPGKVQGLTNAFLKAQGTNESHNREIISKALRSEYRWKGELQPGAPPLLKGGEGGGEGEPTKGAEEMASETGGGPGQGPWGAVITLGRLASV